MVNTFAVKVLAKFKATLTCFHFIEVFYMFNFLKEDLTSLGISRNIDI